MYCAENLSRSAFKETLHKAIMQRLLFHSIIVSPFHSCVSYALHNNSMQRNPVKYLKWSNCPYLVINFVLASLSCIHNISKYIPSIQARVSCCWHNTRKTYISRYSATLRRVLSLFQRSLMTILHSWLENSSMKSCSIIFNMCQSAIFTQCQNDHYWIQH